MKVQLSLAERTINRIFYAPRKAGGLVRDVEVAEILNEAFAEVRAESAALRESLEEARYLFNLCDPNGDRLAEFGNALSEDAAVCALCERHGFGAVMDSAARQWRAKDGVGAFTTGPCVATVQDWVAKAKKALGQ